MLRKEDTVPYFKLQQLGTVNNLIIVFMYPEKILYKLYVGD